MTTRISPRAGQPAREEDLIDVSALRGAYFSLIPNSEDPQQRVRFGTSGHRGSSLDGSFNERHIWAITQAICDYRKSAGTTGPLFLGIDTHALSLPARTSALEVLAANGVDVRVAPSGQFTPTPAVSLAILDFNRMHAPGPLADGIIVTPSHNPPRDGGFKYNLPHGGPADSHAASVIEELANQHLAEHCKRVRRVEVARPLASGAARPYDFLQRYVVALSHVIDLQAIRESGIRIGVDPMGGAGLMYWEAIADRYGLPLTVVNANIDPTFSFMPLDWDGQIRMDPSSAFAMQALTRQCSLFDVAFACDTDHDRHGVVCPSSGLLPPNHFLSVATDYLLMHRPQWPMTAAVGKTVVTTSMIDRIAQAMDRRVLETPVGFKWFAQGLHDCELAVACEESAGASFLRRDGSVWTTEKDGIVAGLLAAEITARAGADPGLYYRTLSATLGLTWSDRIDAPAARDQRARLANATAEDLQQRVLAGDEITQVQTRAPGNDQPIGGIKLTSRRGWVAMRPSGTEDVYKVYAESFESEEHLQMLLCDALSLADGVMADAEA
ncbi:alpha-D-glucose phosphate-specific phosphoglucomutase [Mitsuaria sp. GD03876]|uniref:alpha-D-glucose phosphate-specific phosphoglucomutase n=1 Tax=Mitsuaria sp. GD03876 TaxID=2975399 RepID=UPI0024499E23|nr:alpha-D-glucose phosphate-specific phosphoglucomutase [Mitsuaria sp. GD03876]MDH0863699.1 alpha-D-glucose phosphate-specific phosphoglucomutase [Mitsuaria sp. GD03876]